MECLQWEFDTKSFDAAVSQLVGQPIIMGGVREGAESEIVRFHIGLSHLEVGNCLTRETAASVLHLFLHLGSARYVHSLCAALWNYVYEGPNSVNWALERDGAHLNPGIFTALRQARSGRVLELYSRLYMTCVGANIFQKVLGESVKVYSSS